MTTDAEWKRQISDFDMAVWRHSPWLWFKWTTGLIVGKLLRRIGGVIRDAGWRMINQAAIEVDRRVRDPHS